MALIARFLKPRAEVWSCGLAYRKRTSNVAGTAQRQTGAAWQSTLLA